MGSMVWRQVDAVWARARSVEVAARRPCGDRPSVMVGRADDIAELAGLLEVDLAADPFICMCLGDFTFTVRGERGTDLGVLTLHLDSDLHWNRWHGQLPLLRPEELKLWLARHGSL
ncbi:hypothetical protein AB0I84_35580 [Streptomyces spectabilis]|uniref:hypothetical protein n=1 Tax=Streptomyces spectabilis TaxID=68270 RepID=UPI0033DCF4DB